MHALDILGDPVRRRLLELLADDEFSAGELGAVVQREFGISQPAVSQHLRVLRESGFAASRADGARRIYALNPGPLAAADDWYAPFRRFWQPRLDAIGTELARGRRQRRIEGRPSGPVTADGADPDTENDPETEHDPDAENNPDTEEE
jgi:DNA-binding transcriptional ArsR family regulator